MFFTQRGEHTDESNVEAKAYFLQIIIYRYNGVVWVYRLYRMSIKQYIKQYNVRTTST